MSQKKRTSYNPSPAEPRRGPAPWLWVGLGLALLLVVAGVLLLWRPGGDPDFTPVVSGAPKLKVDQTAVDAGYVKFETLVQAAFRLQNVGDKPLQILGEPQVELIEGC